MIAQKVLIPLDGSEFSRQIIAPVRHFLDPAKHELILLRVAHRPQGLTARPAQPASIEWPVPMYYPSRMDAKLAQHPIYASQVEDSLVTHLKDEVQTELHYLQEMGYTVSMAIKFGEPAQEILDFIAENDINLVAMTTHGRTGLSRLVFGSVAERVLRKAAVPVLLLRPVAESAAIADRDQVSHGVLTP